MQSDPGKMIQPSMLTPQKGEVVFCNQNKCIAYIRGEDGRIYASTDRITLKELMEVSETEREPTVYFQPITGNGLSACNIVVYKNGAPISYSVSKNESSNISSPKKHLQTTPVVVTTKTLETSKPILPVNTPTKFKSVFSRTPSAPNFQYEKDKQNTVCQLPKKNMLIVNYPLFKKGKQIQQYQSSETIKIVVEHKEQTKPIIIRPKITMKQINQMTEEELHKVLNHSYKIPELFNQNEYPFPCEGFIVLSNDRKNIMIFTRRLGCITIEDSPERKGRSYCYFLVCGPDDYRAFEYEESQPLTFKSTKFVNAADIETKGFALMAYGSRDASENMWWGWNDQTGFMRCQTGCARILKKKYSNWEPTCQLVMFDAHSSNNGSNWIIKTISYCDIRNYNAYPLQAYFIDDLELIDSSEIGHLDEEFAFFSNTVNDNIYIKFQHLMILPRRSVANEKYGAIIFPAWGRDGFNRQYRALIGAPKSYWNSPNNPNLLELAKMLKVHSWIQSLEDVIKQPDAKPKNVEIPGAKFSSKPELQQMSDEI